MTFTHYPSTTPQCHPQYLKGFGGALVPASEVKVYRLKKNGQRGRLLRILDKDGKPIC